MGGGGAGAWNVGSMGLLPSGTLIPFTGSEPHSWVRRLLGISPELFFCVFGVFQATPEEHHLFGVSKDVFGVSAHEVLVRGEVLPSAPCEPFLPPPADGFQTELSAIADGVRTCFPQKSGRRHWCVFLLRGTLFGYIYIYRKYVYM